MADAGCVHLVDGVVIASDDAYATSAGLDRAAVVAMRAARPIVDRLDRAERSRVGCVVLSHPTADAPRVNDIARRVAAGLSLGAGLALPVAGLGAGGLFAALHVAKAVLTSPAQATALVVCLSDGCAGAFLLAPTGGAACRPLPPLRAPLAPRGGAKIDVELYGAALALALEKGGVRRRSVRRVASPGLGCVEAAHVAREAGLAHALAPSVDVSFDRTATVEAAMAAALARPPSARTLIWAMTSGGHVSACLLEPP